MKDFSNVECIKHLFIVYNLCKYIFIKCTFDCFILNVKLTMCYSSVDNINVPTQIIRNGVMIFILST